MMGFSRGVVFLLLLYLLQGSDTSLVRLNENGYEDIIIAIDPAVPEDVNIIDRIKVRKLGFLLFELGRIKRLIVIVRVTMETSECFEKFENRADSFGSHGVR